MALTHFQFLANSRRDRQQTSCPFPFAHSPIEFPTTLELKTKAKIRTVCRNGNATKGKQSWRQLKKAVLFYLFISVVAPKTFLISHYFLAAL